MNTSNSVLYFKSSTLDGLRHGFFGRQGGVSADLVGSLNCYPYIREKTQQIDALENVHRNRNIILNTLGVEAPDVITAQQVHGDTIVTVRSHQSMDFVDADGMITDVPNLPIGILTADCVPVLYADIHHKVVGAVHAGWKGAFLKIQLKMIQKFHTMGIPINHVKAVIGPSIQQGSYEVDHAFYDQFVSQHNLNQSYFYPSTQDQHYQFDLARLVYDDLMAAGIFSVDWVRLDTAIHSDIFFSHRRATRIGSILTGRQLSMICA